MDSCTEEECLMLTAKIFLNAPLDIRDFKKKNHIRFEFLENVTILYGK